MKNMANIDEQISELESDIKVIEASRRNVKDDKKEYKRLSMQKLRLNKKIKESISHH